MSELNNVLNINEQEYSWNPPIPFPEDLTNIIWDEATLSWTSLK